MIEAFEEWLPVPRCPWHQASSLGLVRYKDKKGEWVFSKFSRGSHGYLMVNLRYEEGTRGSECVHSLICRTFHGARPGRLDCCHNDGNKDNCRKDNLRWDTRKNNIADQTKHGTFGWKGKRKLTVEQAKEILSKVDAGGLVREIAEEYGVAHHTISAINLGETYRETGRKREDADPNSRRGSKMQEVLSEEDVKQIVLRINAGERQREIAESFGVKPQSVSAINIGNTWAWLTGRTAETSRPQLKKTTKVLGAE